MENYPPLGYYTDEHPLSLSKVKGFKTLIISLKGWVWAENGEPLEPDNPAEYDGAILFLSLSEIKEIGTDEKGRYIIFREADDEHDGTGMTKAYIMSYWVEAAKGRFTSSMDILTL